MCKCACNGMCGGQRTASGRQFPCSTQRFWGLNSSGLALSYPQSCFSSLCCDELTHETLQKVAVGGEGKVVCLEFDGIHTSKCGVRKKRVF